MTRMILRALMLSTSLILGVSVVANQEPAAPPQTASPTPETACKKAVDAQDAAAKAYTASLNKFQEEHPPDSIKKPQACVGGTIRWERTAWKMDVPEITLKRSEWKMDVPETWLGQQEWWVKEPIVVCEDRKVGQYPQTTCEDTWIEAFGVKTKGVPRCTVTWHDIITKVCWPETRDKKIVLGVPEFKMTTKSFSMDVPQVTMKTQEMSLHLPQFFAESGCIAADCADKCKGELDTELEKANAERNAAVGPAQKELIGTTATMFQCQVTSIEGQRDSALSQFDKYIAVAQKTMEEMRVQGLTAPADEQQKRLDQMKAERQKIKEDLDKTIDQLHAEEKKAIQAVGS